MENLKSNRKLQVLAGLGVLAGIILGGCMSSWFDAEPSNRPAFEFAPAPPAPAPAPEAAAAEVIERHLEWADIETSAGLDSQLAVIHEFFAQAHQGIDAFCQDALGWDSKWKLVTGYIAGGDDHRKFLEERFAARMFSPESLDAVVQFAVAGYLQHVEDVDAQLLIMLKQDLADVPSAEFLPSVDPNAIQSLLDGAIQNAAHSVEAELPGTIGQELVSVVAGEALTFAGVQMATTAGIVSAGAASSGPVTFAAGIVVGLIVDALLNFAYDEMFDPALELSIEVDGTLLMLERLILDGNGEEPGLQSRLLDYAARRGEARNAAIRSVVFP